MTLVYDPLTGFPDFGIAKLIDIIEYLEILRKESIQTSQNLHDYKQEVEENREKFDEPDDILGYIEFFLIIIGNYSNEFERLSSELKSSVKEQHLISFEQLYEHSIKVDKHDCRGFKREHIVRKLKDEELRYLLDMIYSDTGNLMYSFRSCAAIKKRLEALIGTKTVPYNNEGIKQFEEKYGKSKLTDSDKKKLRPNQLDKEKCREVAEELWKKHYIRSREMAGRPELIEVAKEYTLETRRRWICDLAPSELQKPGRPPKK